MKEISYLTCQQQVEPVISRQRQAWRRSDLPDFHSCLFLVFVIMCRKWARVHMN